MRAKLALVFSGGGARGALQVGAVKALIEKGITPDLMVGTSIGAMNAALLSIYGFNERGVTRLEQTWLAASQSQVFAGNFLMMVLREVVNRPAEANYQKLRDFLISQGVLPELRFRELRPMRLIVTATDLNERSPAYLGLNPDTYVLDALLASAALPPWISPQKMDDHLYIDGGAVCNLPLEAVLLEGAHEIIALDLSEVETPPPAQERRGLQPFIYQYLSTMERHQTDLQLALVAARRVRLHRIFLRAPEVIQVWNLALTEDLIERGYETAKEEIAHWQEESQSTWRRWITGIYRRRGAPDGNG